MSSSSYLSPQQNRSAAENVYADYVNKNAQKLERLGRLNSSVYNPVNGKVYLEDPYIGKVEDFARRGDKIPWDKMQWTHDTVKYQKGLEQLAAGKINEDQAEYNFINSEWQDEALRYNEAIEQHGAGIITSTEFPAFTVTSIETALINMEQLQRIKYNLLQIVRTINTDQLVIRFPRWNDTTPSVKVGYKENDPIDTINWGNLTEQQITVEKAGVGFGFTEEYYMRTFTFPIENFILNKIAFDFTRVRHDQLLASLPSFPDITGLDWGAYTPGNLASTNKPSVDLNAAKTAIRSNKLYNPDTIISNELQWIDYDTNTWTNAFGQAQIANNTNVDDVITSPRGIPWCRRWILNEDIANNKAYVIDSNQLIMVEGPRKTTQAQLVNPDQTVEYRKEWFKFTLFDTAAGRELVSI